MATEEGSPTDLSGLKIPPHSTEAEEAVLGGLMIGQDSWESIEGLIRSEDFYHKKHRKVFRVMKHLASEDKPLDVVTVSDALSELKELEEVGGIAFLAGLANETPSASNVSAYASIVRERAIARQLIKAANQIADNSFFPDGRSSQALLEEAEQAVAGIAEGSPKTGEPEHISPLLSNVLARIEELEKNGGDLIGVSTGFTDLDKLTAGLQKGDLIIIAGRPSMGKTSFAMNIVEHAALKEEKPIVVFSLEMPKESLVMRMLSSQSRIDQSRLRMGKVRPGEWPMLSAAISKFQGRPLHIDDTPALTPTEMRARLRRVYKEHGGVSLVMVDYLQLMRVQGGAENRTNEISEISRSLKGMAKEFDCPLIALSQLNRGVDARDNKRPVMSDLRESGAIEQDADLIAFIYREEVYKPDTDIPGVAEIGISKHRNGPTGMCKLTFLKEFTRFENMAHEAFERD